MWAKRTQDEVTNPSARIRQAKPPRRPAVLWPNEPEGPPTSDWAKMADWAERTQRQAAARTKPVPSPSRLAPPTRLSVENSPVFFLLFTGKAIFALAAVVPALSPRKDQSVAKAAGRKEPAARSSRDSRAILAERTQGDQPGQHLAKRSQGAARSRLWPNKPKGHRVTISAKRTQAADQSASSPTEPDEQPSRSCFRQMNPRCSPVPV
jgi:hypothetical protein